MTAVQPLVLCADDFGMNAATSGAIRALAEDGRISATSCMANATAWPAEAGALGALGGRIGVGMHLTLTWGRPLGPMPGYAPSGFLPTIGEAMKRSLAGTLPGPEIAAEIERQLARFVEWFGRAPDFVDGHQHVHVLPGIRGPLLQVLGRAGLAGRIWLRDTTERPLAVLARRHEIAKATLVGALATGFRTAATDAGFATNRGFSGFSPFDPAKPYGPEMESYLTALGASPLVMCHPGDAPQAAPEPGEEDEIAPARPRERDVLASAAFPAMLAARRIRLVPAPA